MLGGRLQRHLIDPAFKILCAWAKPTFIMFVVLPSMGILLVCFSWTFKSKAMVLQT